MANAYYVHESSVVDEGAQIGAGTRIWHFCHVMGGAVVGEDCNIGQNVFIDNHAVLGNRIKVQNNVSIYQGVRLDDDVFIGPSVVFTNVLNPRSFISRKNEFRTTVVRQGVSIGANATIICGVEIGAYAFIGAGAVVTDNVASFSLILGNPGRQAGWISKSGHRLEFNQEGVACCPADGTRYLLINNKVSAIS